MTRAWLRSWRRSGPLTVQFVLTIAIGTGATTALASVMLALGYQPLPYRDPGRLVAIWGRSESGEHALALSGPDLADFTNATRNVFSSLGAFVVPRLWLFDRKMSPGHVQACGIQASVFSDLGIRPALGRAVRPDDESVTASGTSPVWISYRLWQTRYGGSPSVIGTTIGLADSAAAVNESRKYIAGVLPPGVTILLPFEENTSAVWYLLPTDIEHRSRQSSVFFGVGRLRHGVTVAQAQSALTAVAERLAQRYTVDRGKLPVVEGLETIAHGPAQKTMGLLALGVGLVFLLGCVNVAILMGAEGRQRGREIAIRAALGADRWRLWQEAAVEKSLLTLISLAVGATLAVVLLHVLTRLVPSAGLGPPMLHPPPLNLSVLLGFATIALAAALTWSALLVAAADESRSSRTLGSAGGGPGYTGLTDSSAGAARWRLALLAVQAGVGVFLFAASALTATTYVAVSAADLGPAPRHTILLSVSPRDSFVPTDGQIRDFNDELLLRLERLPGVQSIALADVFPPAGLPVSFMKPGDAAGTARAATLPMSVSPAYFQTLGIPILLGRLFNDADDSGAEPVAIISSDVAERNWPTPRDALGSWIAFGPKYEKHFKIIGVAANFTGYWSQEPVPTIYLAQAQSAYFCGGEVLVRTTNSRKSIAALAPQVLSGMPIAATISDIATMQSRWQATLTRPLARTAGMLLLALLGLALAVQGVYAVAAATTTARRREFAVRSVVGASASQLIWSATRNLVLAVMAGAALGVAAALELRPLFEHWLGPAAVSQMAPVAAAVLVLALAAGVGCYFPARTAVRTNPADVLRLG